MKKRIILAFAVLAVFARCPIWAADAADSLRDQAKALFEPIPQSAPANAAATPEKIALGKMLFFDPRLSENRDLSCASCHNISLGGVSDQPTRYGRPGRLGGRASPTVLNAVFNKAQFWDGRAADLKEHVETSVMVNPGALLKTHGGPATMGSSETNLTKQHVVERLKAIPGYLQPFKKAFPSAPEPFAYANIAEAIADFEATLITPDAPFDKWLKGDDKALDDPQKAGLALFIDKGCAKCHEGINIGGEKFARFGSAQNAPSELLPPDDWGRFGVTKRLEDKYVFKTPGLRNVALRSPYFHSGQAWTLRAAVEIMGQTQLGQKLTDAEADKIVAFLESLTGRQPEVALPILPPSPAVDPGKED